MNRSQLSPYSSCDDAPPVSADRPRYCAWNWPVLALSTDVLFLTKGRCCAMFMYPLTCLYSLSILRALRHDRYTLALVDSSWTIALASSLRSRVAKMYSSCELVFRVPDEDT